nr:DUF4031 domain-containing protein [Fodinicola feengrottensis]
MTVLIDPPRWPGHGRLWSHLVSDLSYEELHAFANRLGIPERAFHRDHYDVPARFYDQAIAAAPNPPPAATSSPASPLLAAAAAELSCWPQFCCGGASGSRRRGAQKAGTPPPRTWAASGRRAGGVGLAAVAVLLAAVPAAAHPVRVAGAPKKRAPHRHEPGRPPAARAGGVELLAAVRRRVRFGRRAGREGSEFADEGYSVSYGQHYRLDPVVGRDQVVDLPDRDHRRALRGRVDDAAALQDIVQYEEATGPQSNN